MKTIKTRVRARAALLLVLLAGATSVGLAFDSRGQWLVQVPAKDRARLNPMAQDASAVSAGAQIYSQHCDSCHGKDARGIGRRPSLRSSRVHLATDGELQWLLRNGSLRHGMPAWSSLPEVQRWQLVRYLHTLPVEDSAE
jgi:mono/diheme cytochrome c family protein